MLTFFLPFGLVGPTLEWYGGRWTGSLPCLMLCILILSQDGFHRSPKDFFPPPPTTTLVRGTVISLPPRCVLFLFSSSSFFYQRIWFFPLSTLASRDSACPPHAITSASRSFFHTLEFFKPPSQLLTPYGESGSANRKVPSSALPI